MSKNEIIGALTVERDKANEARDKAIKERDEAREQVRRIEKRDHMKKELADLDREITKHSPPVKFDGGFVGDVFGKPVTFTYTPSFLKSAI